MGTGFSIGKASKAAVRARKAFQHFRRQGGDGHRLTEALQRRQAPLGHTGGLIEMPTLQVVAHGFEAILQRLAFVFNAPHPVVAGAAVALAMAGGLHQCGEAFRSPAVDPGLALLPPHHQRQGRQPRQGRLHGARLHHARQHPRQPRRRQRQIGHRQLQQHRVVAALAGDRQQFLQQHIANPQGQGLLQPLVETGRCRRRGQARGGQGLAQPLGDRRQSPLPLAQQAIEKLQQARMAADGAQGRRQLGFRPLAQARQPLHQLAGFGPAQRAHGHLQQPLHRLRQRVAAGEQQGAPRGAGEQLLQGAGRVGVEEGFATHAQVLLEVVEHQQQRLLLEQLLHQTRPQPLVEVGEQQLIGQRPGARATPLLQRQTQLQADQAQVETAAVAGDHPAVFRQPLHHPARHAAFAHPADAAQQHTPGRLVVAQAPQTRPQLPAPPHQIADRQLGHRPQQLAQRRLAQRLLLDSEISQGLLLAGAIEGGGGRLRQGFGARGALGQPPLALLLQLAPRRRQGATRQHRFAAA